jgi:UDP-glucose 4-epimerase
MPRTVSRPTRSKRSTKKRPASTRRSIALTGAFGFLGRGLLARLEADPGVDRILALDLKPPAGTLRKTRFVQVDLTRPRSDTQIAEALIEAEVDTLVHLALLYNPLHNSAYAHEVEAIGTLQLLGAASTARVSAVVLASSTALYGAHPDNPNYLTEERPLRPPGQSRFLADKLEVEKQFASFAQQHPQCRVGVLRFAALLGPSVKNPVTRLLARRIVPTLLGYDPLMQFLHEDDALNALALATATRPSGPLNIAPPGVLPLSSILLLLGRTPLPLPSPAADAAMRALWTGMGVGTPPSWLDYLRYLWVADGSRAGEAIGLHYRYTTRETVLAFGRTLQGHAAGVIEAADHGA